MMFMEEVVGKLPPFLQLLLGLGVSLLILKILLMIADFYDKKRSAK